MFKHKKILIKKIPEYPIGTVPPVPKKRKKGISNGVDRLKTQKTGNWVLTPSFPMEKKT